MLKAEGTIFDIFINVKFLPSSFDVSTFSRFHDDPGVVAEHLMTSPDVLPPTVRSGNSSRYSRGRRSNVGQ